MLRSRRRHGKQQKVRLSFRERKFYLLAGIGLFTTFLVSVLLIIELTQERQSIPFPLGVNPEEKVIVENPYIEAYFEMQDIEPPTQLKDGGWVGMFMKDLSLLEFFQHLASPTSKTVVIRAGDRKEEVTKSFGDILRWDAEERARFELLVTQTAPQITEGKFFPGKYVVSKDATPEDMALILIETFEKEIMSRYTRHISELIPLEEALTFASLLEREAGDFEDMRNVSGVIWNRLFLGMDLQLDATLQYVKGGQATQPWWPAVRPADKYLDSPYNTYKYPGLPPAPIANPGLESIVAALNPKETDCIFYIHDRQGNFHCSTNYTEHQRLIREHY